ncbi:plasmid mobilization relaxosome protein MobC, partial [Dysosmobacter welbionis]
SDQSYLLALLLFCVDIGIQSVLGDAEILGDLVAGLGHQKRAVLIQEADGPHLVLLVHQGHGLAHQGHRLLDQLLQQIIDVDDFLRFLLLGFAGGDQIVDRALHHQQ